MRRFPSIQVYSLVNRRQRRQSRRMRGLVRRGQRLGMGVFAVLLLALLGGLVAGGFWYSQLTAGLPSIRQVADLLDPGSGPFLQPTRLYDRTGQHLLLTLENPGIPRRYLKADPAQSDHFSPELMRVAIALIDPTFWQNPGFLIANLTNPQPSTIAERLVSDMLLSQEPPSLNRALRMRILAAELVSQAGRLKVLEWYLNSASFGRLSYGAESAARLYLDKSASELNLAESALLVPLAATPALNPIDAPAAAIERQKAALDILFSAGTISADEHQRALATVLHLRKSAPASASLAPAFTSRALDQAAEQLGRQRLERGGLRITTTLDYGLQQQVFCLTTTQLKRLEGQVNLETDACPAARLLPTLTAETALPANLAASAVLLDPRSGEVLALLGDTTLQGEGLSLQPHPAGTLLSPFAAVTEFARGYGPASLVWDVPDAVDGQALSHQAAALYHGPVRLRQALANDYSAPLLRLLDQFGAANVWQLASSLGLESLSEENSSAGLLGGVNLSPLELAQGYTLFANLGTVYGQPTAESGTLVPNTLLYVEDSNGHMLLDHSKPASQPLVSAPIAYLIHNVISDEPARWPSLGFPNPLEIGRTAGAKSGSTSDQHDSWVAGYTPQRLGLIWLGLPSGSSARLDPRQSAAIWHALIQYASQDLPAQDWTEPAGISHVSVCDPSGQLPTAACPAVVSEIFLNGNEPVSSDTLYQTVQINRETGRLATVFTPPELVEEKVFLQVPVEARAWAEATGQAVAPTTYDIIQAPLPSAQVRITTPAQFGYLRGQVEIRGTASGKGFVSYHLQAGAGLNPQSWLQIGGENRTAVENGKLGVWDTSGLDGLYALRLVVVRSDNTVENAILQVTVDNTPPVARLTYPQNGQEVSAGASGQLTLQAEAEDGVGLAKLEWLLDGKLSGENRMAPYSQTWTLKPGKHSLVLRATDLAGNVSESTPVEFTVK